MTPFCRFQWARFEHMVTYGMFWWREYFYQLCISGLTRDTRCVYDVQLWSLLFEVFTRLGHYHLGRTPSPWGIQFKVFLKAFIDKCLYYIKQLDFSLYITHYTLILRNYDSSCSMSIIWKFWNSKKPANQ